MDTPREKALAPMDRQFGKDGVMRMVDKEDVTMLSTHLAHWGWM